MISIKNLNKQFERKVLDNFSYDFPDKGLIFILGDSGCGKTTLLNCIAGLEDFEGNIIINGNDIKNMTEKIKDQFRLKNIGIIFQDFKLFNKDSVLNNILFPLKILSNESDKFMAQKTKDLLRVVNLSGYEQKIVENLSGGEKQRVAIARSLVNDPSFILADEPTGSLDSKNSLDILEILKIISKDKLVIVVTHDEQLTEKYADKIIRLKDGKINQLNEYSSISSQNHLSVIKNKYYAKKPSIPLSFLIKHTFTSLKIRKWRMLICNLIMSFSLIGCGLSFVLSDNISSSIKSSCSSFLGDDRVVASKPIQSYNKFIESGSYEEACYIKDNFKDCVNDVGVVYHNDFDSLFKDRNSFSLVTSSFNQQLPYFNASSINEFLWLDNYPNEVFYPERPKSLNNDEIVISLNNSQISSICSYLSIYRTIESLSDYIKTFSLYVVFDTSNQEWEYDDQHIFKVKAFSLDNLNRIYHYNHLWNKFIFEDEMRLPINYSINTIDLYPWTLKKVVYFDVKNPVEDFIKNFYNEEELDDFMVDIASQEYFPDTISSDMEPKSINKYLFFLDKRDALSPRYSKYICNSAEELTNPILGNPGAYSIYGNILMSGFSNYLYVSNNEDALFNTLEEFSSYNVNENVDFEFPKEIKIGHYSKSLIDGVSFESIKDELTYEEIGISTKLNEDLFGGEGLGKTLYIAYTTKDIKYNDKIVKEYKYYPLLIKYIKEDDKYKLYHNVEWTNIFFLTRLGISNNLLGTNAISFKNNDREKSSEIIENLSGRYSYLEFSNPVQDIENSVDNVCFYVEIAMILLSFITSCISIILLTMCNYLHLNDVKKDIALSRVIGVSKKESCKFILIHSFLMTFISLIISIFELVIVSILISIFSASMFNVQFTFIINPLSIVMMMFLGLIIGIISTLLTINKIIKVNPIEAIKE